MKKPYKWLSRKIAFEGPYLTLVLSESELKQACAYLNVPAQDWPVPPANARAYSFESPVHGEVVIVCLAQTDPPASAIQVAGLLVHEAVHVWQHYCDRIGETNPGREQEAYAIQLISQSLMGEYARRMGAE